MTNESQQVGAGRFSSYNRPMDGWALDLGTTNTGLARWDADAERARLVELPNICRAPGREDPLEAPRLVPSATHLLPATDFWSRLGGSPFFLKRAFWGRLAEIGRPALELNQGWTQPSFAPSFKRDLGKSAHKTLARVRGRTVSAREVARTFLRELLAETQRTTGTRIRDLVITVPVESYDAYRAELAQLCTALGVKRVRFVDEPVAAAIGYGLGLRAKRRVLVVDFGGGTLDLALVELDPRDAAQGACTVIAKEGRPIGGNVIDEWLLDHFAERMDMPTRPVGGEEAELWHGLMLAEARRIKEAVYFPPHKASFELSPPPELRGVAARLAGGRFDLDVTRDDLVAHLTARGMYAMLADCADGIARQLERRGLDEEAIDEVLMVGGSTLLPGVFGVFEGRYGRNRVRAWQPFEAVAYGASAFAAGRFGQSDFLVHDYAFVTYDPRTHDKQYTPIIEHGARFPVFDVWRRQLVPTCALGEPEKVFKLVVCEIAGGADERKFIWDADGNLHRVGQHQKHAPIVVPLNETNPALGFLDPPHPPGDRTPRLDIAFGVDENRWLIATVRDLKSGRTLMERQPVVRLL
ncbi:MAG: Hsp70 family protein [Myxococcales bacterium]|nr:Hsp70 family protein [Myxococcales bacterium]